MTFEYSRSLILNEVLSTSFWICSIALSLSSRPRFLAPPQQFQSVWVYIGTCDTNPCAPERLRTVKETYILSAVQPAVSGATSTRRLLKALKTYSLIHDQSDALNGLMAAYNTILKTMQQCIWQTIEWKKPQIYVGYDRCADAYLPTPT
jgi:hypothetical protein